MAENKSDLPMHPEAAGALGTRRVEMVRALRARLGTRPPQADISLLLNALETAVAELAELDHRLRQIGPPLADQAKTLEGLLLQSERIREVAEKGGAYQNRAAREGEHNEPA